MSTRKLEKLSPETESGIYLTFKAVTAANMAIDVAALRLQRAMSDQSGIEVNELEPVAQDLREIMGHLDEALCCLRGMPGTEGEEPVQD